MEYRHLPGGDGNGESEGQERLAAFGLAEIALTVFSHACIPHIGMVAAAVL
jgi:hypothetical protein